MECVVVNRVANAAKPLRAVGLMLIQAQRLDLDVSGAFQLIDKDSLLHPLTACHWKGRTPVPHHSGEGRLLTDPVAGRLVLIDKGCGSSLQRECGPSDRFIRSHSEQRHHMDLVGLVVASQHIDVQPSSTMSSPPHIHWDNHRR